MGGSKWVGQLSPVNAFDAKGLVIRMEKAAVRLEVEFALCIATARQKPSARCVTVACVWAAREPKRGPHSPPRSQAARLGWVSACACAKSYLGGLLECVSAGHVPHARWRGNACLLACVPRQEPPYTLKR